MKWKFKANNRGEFYVSDKGYRIEKGPKEVCYSVIAPEGNYLVDIFYYARAAKFACKEHLERTAR